MGHNEFKQIAELAFLSRLKRWVFLLLPSRISVWLFTRLLDSDRERNSLVAAQFLVDAQETYPSKFGILLPKFLRFALKLAQTNLPNTFLQLFINSVTESRRPSCHLASLVRGPLARRHLQAPLGGRAFC